MASKVSLKGARQAAARGKIVAGGGFRRETMVVSQEVKEARKDFTAYCSLLGYSPADHMKQWHHELVTGETEGPLIEIAGPNTKILSPRGSAKSATTCMFISWALGRASVERLLLRSMIISYALPVSRGKSGVIKRILQSEEFQQCFPNVVLSKDRTSDELWHIDYDRAHIDVGSEDIYSVCATGILGSIVSKRVNLAVLDDLIKSLQSIKDPAVRREMVNNWNSLIKPCMFKDGTSRAINLGTRFHWDDISATTFTEEQGWVEMTQKALLFDEDGAPCSYWEAKMPLKELLKEKEQDPIAFAYQYQNEAPRASEIGVPEELLQRVQVPDEYDEIAVGVDLSAGTKESNDYTVLTLGGVLDGIIYLIDYRRFRAVGNIEKIDQLCELLAEWNILRPVGDGEYAETESVVTVVPEEVAYQLSFKGDAEAVLHNERGLYNILFRGLPGRGDKLTKQRAVIGRIERGALKLNRFRRWDPVVEELTNVGQTTHDDCADSIELLCRFLGRHDRGVSLGSAENTGERAAEKAASELVYPKSLS